MSWRAWRPDWKRSAQVVSLSSRLAAVGAPSERLQEIEEQLQALRNRLEKLEQVLRSGEPA
jgi:prefoldin subunit 5